MLSQLAKAIYKTIAFFDAQDMPVTLIEVRNYLVEYELKNVLLSDIEQVLEGELKNLVLIHDGFYSLLGRRDLLTLRRLRYQVSLVRMRKAKRVLKGLRFMPFLRGVAISGSLALLNSSEDSDIDLFVITQKNRVWLARFLISAYFQVMGQRRYGNKIKNRFCLNHYLAEDISISTDQNLYTAVEYASMIPVLGKPCFQKFWNENFWIENYLLAHTREIQNHWFDYEFSWWQKVLEQILNLSRASLANRILGKIQKSRIKIQNFILVSEDELSFHPGSTGQQVMRDFQSKIQKIGLD